MELVRVIALASLYLGTIACGPDGPGGGGPIPGGANAGAPGTGTQDGGSSAAGGGVTTSDAGGTTTNDGGAATADGGAPLSSPDAGSPSGSGVVGADIPGVDDYVRAQMVASQTPGLAAAIVKGGAVKWARGYGFANDAKAPVTPNTLFHIASVSKTITATAAMQLVESGALALDDDVSTALGFSLRNPGFAATPITLRMLLTHTSSVADKADASFYVTGDSPISLHDYVHGLLQAGGTWYGTDSFDSNAPGTTFLYSNPGVSTAGFLVEQKAGTSFAAYTKAHILAPLGMTSTVWRFADADNTRLATPYQYDTATNAYTALPNGGYPDYPSGMLITSVLEYASFLNAFIQDGTNNGVTILKTATAQEMKRPQVPTVDANQAIVFYYFQTSTGRRVLGHNGGDPGVTTVVGFDPTNGAGAVVFSNGDAESSQSLDATFETILARLVDEAVKL